MCKLIGVSNMSLYNYETGKSFPPTKISARILDLAHRAGIEMHIEDLLNGHNMFDDKEINNLRK